MGKERRSLKDQAIEILLWQGCIIIGLALIMLLIQGIQAGYSALLGGLSYWFPTLLFAIRVFTYQTAHAAKQFIVAFFVGEMVKLFLSAFSFVLIVQYLPVSVLATLMGFAGAIIAFWVVCGVRFSKVQRG